MNKNITKLRDDINMYRKFDVLCFNETNCNPDNLPGGANDLIIEGFHPPIVQAPARKSDKGGGLITYISDTICNINDIDIIPNLCSNDNPKEGEFMFVRIKAGNGLLKTAIIGNMYKSPSAKPSTFMENLKHKMSSLNKYKNKLVYLGGDTNIDLLKYDYNTHAQELSEITLSSNYIQLISRPTRITEHSATLIDHVYTNCLEYVTSSGIVTVDMSDHLGTYVNFSLGGLNNNHQAANDTSHNVTSGKFRKMNDENLEKFRVLIENENWASVDSANDAQSKYDKFIKVYTDHYNTAFPLSASSKRKNQRNDPKPWILPWLEGACARKNTCYYEYIKTPTTENLTKYTKLKKFVEKHIKKAKLQYYTNYFNQYSADSRMQWKMINELLNKNKKKISVSKLIIDGNDITNRNDVANAFNNYFCNIAAKLKVDNQNLHSHFTNYLTHPQSNTIYLANAEPDEIKDIIKKLKNKSTSDTAVTALKAASLVPKFDEVVADLISSSFSDGVFPEQLKLAKVVPIYKSGKRTEVSNYRPVSLLSTFSKVYEKIMHHRVDNYLNTHNILYENQFGFRRGHSCEHALLSAQNKIIENLDKKQITLLLLIDFSKAFDMVDHNTLLYKLNHYGIRGMALKWFESYLKNRKQYTHANNVSSETGDLEHGPDQTAATAVPRFLEKSR